MALILSRSGSFYFLLPGCGGDVNVVTMGVNLSIPMNITTLPLCKENTLRMEAEYFRVRKSLTLITLIAPES